MSIGGSLASVLQLPIRALGLKTQSSWLLCEVWVFELRSLGLYAIYPLNYFPNPTFFPPGKHMQGFMLGFKDRLEENPS